MNAFNQIYSFSFFFKRVLLREMSDDDPQGRTPQVDWNMHWKLLSEALV